MKKNSIIALIAVALLVIAGFWFNYAEASRYTQNNIINNYNNYYSGEHAAGACALSKAADSFSPYVHSQHWQYAIGVGHCEGNGHAENAIDFGIAKRILRNKKHSMMGSCSIGRSSDEYTAIGCGISGHFD